MKARSLFHLVLIAATVAGAPPSGQAAPRARSREVVESPPTNRKLEQMRQNADRARAAAERAAREAEHAQGQRGAGQGQTERFDRVGGACANVCREYQSAGVQGAQGSSAASDGLLNARYVTNRCGAIPGGDRTAASASGSLFVGHRSQDRAVSSDTSAGRVGLERQGLPSDLRTDDAEWDKCFSDLQAKWNQTGPHCSAIAVQQSGRKQEKIAAIAYTVAAATCAGACAAELTGVAAWARTACLVAGGGAVVADITASLAVESRGAFERMMGNWSDRGVSAAGAGGVTSAALVVGPSKTVERQIGSCLSAGLFTAAATLRYTSMASAGNAADRECRNLRSLLGDNAVTDPDGGGGQLAQAAPGGYETQRGGAASSAVATGKGGGTAGGSGGGYMGDFDDDIKSFASPRYATALSGPFGNLIKTMPNLDRLPVDLQKATGLSAKEIGRRLDAGQSPGQILGGMSGLGEVGKLVAATDRAVLDGRIRLGGGAEHLAATMSSGGGKAPAAAGKPANPFQFSFQDGAPGPGGNSEQSFEKAKRERDPGIPGDIWHEGYGGTIFQIVSNKLERERERVVQLEWDTPLNRALAGLPARKEGAKPAPVRK